MFEDLRWFGLEWQEGPDCGGPYGPYSQSERRRFYVDAFERLRAGGHLFRCTCSRQDVLRAAQAPHAGEDEPLYPGTCRGNNGTTLESATRATWRFRVPDGEAIEITDGHYGPQRFVAGKDLGDFVVWRHDDLPSYQLAVVVDDAAMQITEVVRGQDLLKSTARQLLLYRALGWTPPDFFHCPLVTDDAGVRLAKRHDSLSLRALRAKGIKPEDLRNSALA
jgi:glutamyl-tRNA synthetase